MKVLIYDHTCAYLTPGGKTTHALKLQQEISKLGVDIQFARWWDQSQEDADIIHFLSADADMAKTAKQKGMKTFFSMIFDFESNKSERAKRYQRIKNRFIDRLPYSVSKSAYWKALPYMDIVQFMHIYDKSNAFAYFPRLLREDKTVLIPHAYDPAEMNISGHLDIREMKFPDKYLVSVANISPRKQTLKLAQYAKASQVPVVFMGSHRDDLYYKQFMQEVDNKYVYYPGYVSKAWRDCIESHASGFVLLSLGESGCIAVYEAAAYHMPLLLSNKPWAWGYEHPTDIFFCDQQDSNVAIGQLRQFYEKAEKLERPPFQIHTWAEVAEKYVDCYESILRS
ncbi:glycosyltransferase [Phocaeicola massiliensis]|uniref:glycosyltransferase n=1 Tax=Phocaeicola massiliensis TaxID=204516 RepID=UPI00202DFDC4|nr:glycosyltransferase [Phocaeicola massiliensis]MCM1613868.1 glycosyltransferase [Phocaeicola massiliensis]MCM1705855.1 glycosyltransferase [Phocaeicola massiliensis]